MGIKPLLTVPPASASRPVEYLRPRAQVIFVGTQYLFARPEDVLSVRTMKSLGSPHGTFEITLKASGVPLDGTEARTSVRRGLSPAQPRATWFDVLTPMTLVKIAFGEQHDLEQLTEDLSVNATNAAVAKRSITMLGYVESVSISTDISQAGSQRMLTVRGSDLAKLLTIDSTYHARNSALNLWNTSVKSGFDYVGVKQEGESTDFGYTKAEVLRLLNRIAQTNDEGKNGFRMAMAAGNPLVSAATAFQTLARMSPSFDVAFKNGKRLIDYMARDATTMHGYVDPQFNNLTLRQDSYLWHSGPLWTLFAQIFPRPTVEFFMDTVGDEFHTIIRRPPFARPHLTKHADALFQRFAKRLEGGKAQAEAATASISTLFTGTDDFTNAKLRVIEAEANRHYHEISGDEIVSLHTHKTDQGVFTVYQALSELAMQGASGLLEYTYPLLADIPGVKQFGMRFLQLRSPWYGFSRMDTPDDPTHHERQDNPIFYALALREATYAYYYFRDNAALLSGTLSIRGRSSIRVGDRITFAFGGSMVIAYVESVGNMYGFGQEYLTQIQYSRMQPLAASDVTNGRLVDYDGEDIDLEYFEATGAASPAKPKAPRSLLNNSMIPF